jgi:hypothetical protein
LGSFDLEEPDYTEMELGRGLSLHDVDIQNEIRNIINKKTVEELRNLPKNKAKNREAISNMILPVMLKHRQKGIHADHFIGFTRGVIARKLMTKREKKTNNNDEDIAIIIPTTPVTQVPKKRKPPMTPKGPPAPPMTPKGPPREDGTKKSRRRGKAKN